MQNRAWPPQDGLAVRLVEIADQLRTLANTGLVFTQDPYQVERYHKVIHLAARLLSEVDGRSPDQIQQIFFSDLDMVTPLAVVDVAVFDDGNRLLLIQRADDHLWAMPGGACDVGEAPASGGAREVWEETGCVCRVTDLLGVFDSRLCQQRTSRHLYHFLFAGRSVSGQLRTSRETLDVRWYRPADIPWDHISPGHGPRIRHALAWKNQSNLATYFDDEGWHPPEDF